MMVVDGKTIQVLLPVGAYLIWKLVSLRIDLDDECNGIRCWDHIHSRNTWGGAGPSLSVFSLRPLVLVSNYENITQMVVYRKFT